MTRKEWTRMIFMYIISTLLAICMGCTNSSETKDDGLRVQNSKYSGYWSGFWVQSEDEVSSWDNWGDFIGMDAQGDGSVSIDDDLDGFYENDWFYYTIYEDGTIRGDVFDGIINENEEIIVLIDTDRSDNALAIQTAIKEASSMQNSDFFGAYIVCEFGFDVNTNAHWTSRWELIANGNGTFDYSILDHSDGSTGSGSMDYVMSENGRFVVTTNGDKGMLIADGSCFVLLDDDYSDQTLEFSIGVRKSTGVTLSSLAGEYIVVRFEGDKEGGVIDFYTSFIESVVDNAGGADFEILAASDNDLISGHYTFTVTDTGEVTIPETGDQGIASVNNGLLVFVDTDSSNDDDVSLTIGVKKTR